MSPRMGDAKRYSLVVPYASMFGLSGQLLRPWLVGKVDGTSGRITDLGASKSLRTDRSRRSGSVVEGTHGCRRRDGVVVERFSVGDLGVESRF